MPQFAPKASLFAGEKKQPHLSDSEPLTMEDGVRIELVEERIQVVAGTKLGNQQEDVLANTKVTRQKKRKDRNPGCPSPSADSPPERNTQPCVARNHKGSLFEWLGQDMAHQLVNKAKSPESMSFIDLLRHRADPSIRLSSESQSPQDLLGDWEKNKAVLISNLPSMMPESRAASLTSAHASSGHSSSQVTQTTARQKKRKYDINTFTLDDFAALGALSSLVERFGRVSHMGILDPSYNFFMNKSRNAALYYKVRDKIAVVGGDPLCYPDQYQDLLQEFRQFRKKKGWGIAYLGATDDFAQDARQQKKCVTIRFGTERVLNPLTNPIIMEKDGKRLIKQNKALLDPSRGGVRVETYIPSQGKNLIIQEQLVHVYNTWRQNRSNSRSRPQAYMTVFDPFALPHLMIYIYTIDIHSPNGLPNGFAALRKIGANRGYHLDPYCALPGAPRGISDLLIFAAMALLKQAGVGYLSLGFEPARELQRSEISGMNGPMAHLSQVFYRKCFKGLQLDGKKKFHDKWRPDPELESGLHIIFPDGLPGRKHALAVLHIANISVRQLLKAELRWGMKRVKDSPENAAKGAGTLERVEKGDEDHQAEATIEEEGQPDSNVK